MSEELPSARRDRLAVWNRDEDVRIARIRRDARRPPAINLAEGLAISELLAGFTGAARRTASAG